MGRSVRPMLKSVVDPNLIRAWHARWRLVRAAPAEQSQPRSAADKLAAVERLRAFGRRHTRGRGDDEAAVWERCATLRSRYGDATRG